MQWAVQQLRLAWTRLCVRTGSQQDGDAGIRGAAGRAAHRHAHRPVRERHRRHQDAPILPVWRHRQLCGADGEHVQAWHGACEPGDVGSAGTARPGGRPSLVRLLGAVVAAKPTGLVVGCVKM